MLSQTHSPNRIEDEDRNSNVYLSAYAQYPTPSPYIAAPVIALYMQVSRTE